MIKDRKSLDIYISMLTGNINRMCVTNDLTELDSMKEWALLRVNEIYNYNLSRLNNKISD